MSDELDDFFRQELDGHASEPGADLWARLQARTGASPPAADADPLDAKFRAGLAAHATPPRRALWERLEDEHLRPRQRRRPVVAWGRLAVAASLLLLLLAGGAGLWRGKWGQGAGPVASSTGQPTGQPAGTVAHTNSQVAKMNSQPTQAGRQAADTGSQPATDVARAATGAKATGRILQMPVISDETKNQLISENKEALAANAQAGREKKHKYFSGQATAPGALPSSSPVASTGRPRRPATAQRPVPTLPPTTPLPDAAAGTLAHNGGRKTPAGQSSLSSTTANALALALASADAPDGIIEVEVRRGPAPATPLPVSVATAAATPSPRRSRIRVGGLLRQADHLLHGEAVSLADAREPGEPLTLQAHLGGRTLSKTIQL